MRDGQRERRPNRGFAMRQPTAFCPRSNPQNPAPIDENNSGVWSEGSRKPTVCAQADRTPTVVICLGRRAPHTSSAGSWSRPPGTACCPEPLPASPALLAHTAVRRKAPHGPAVSAALHLTRRATGHWQTRKDRMVRDPRWPPPHPHRGSEDGRCGESPKRYRLAPFHPTW